MRFDLQDELQSLGFAFKRPSEHFKNMNSRTESEGQTPQLPNTQDASESSARVNTAESASERLKLKPCPFCGGKAVIKRFDDYGTGENQMCWFKCTKCYASSFAFKSKTCAMRAWNRRVE